MSTFDATFLDRFSTVEDRHFWFQARNRIIFSIASELAAGMAPGYRVLEVGCGTGVVLAELEKACPGGRVAGMDLFIEGLRHARRRTGVPLVQGDLNHLPFAPGFDLVGLFDVLEHIPDDRAVLHRLFDLTAPGGRLLMTVPAHRELWSYFDESNYHCRRYEPDELRTKLQESGYVVEYLTGFMTTLYPLVWLGRRLSSLTRDKRGPAQASARELAFRELSVVPVLNGILSFALRQEGRLLESLRARGRSLPIGTSLLALARRPGGEGP